jgi:hypothetical protein
VVTSDDAEAHDVTLTEVLAELTKAGYVADFFVDEDDGQVCCGSCRACQPPESLQLDGLRRIEGASDPADMAAVLALTCPSCGTKGTAIVRFGPEASAGDAIVLQHLDDARPRGLDVAEDAAT